MARPTDVAIFLPAVSIGGAERTLINLAHGLIESGVTIDIVIAWAGGPLRCELPEKAVVVDLFSQRTSLALVGLVRYLRRVQPKQLLTCDHCNIVALWARRLARVTTRVVITEHQSYRGNPRRGNGRRARLLVHLARRHYRSADAIVAVSQGVADDVIALTGLTCDRVEVIHNPIRLPRIRAMAQEPPGHPWFDDHSVPVVLAVGRLAPEKDFATLIGAFALVQSRRAARLVILGEGSERRNLEAMIQRTRLGELVALPGAVANPFACMARAAVLALSSVTEGLPQVLVEALACGCPVVATDCPSGPREILQNGQFGTLVPMGDPQALADAIGDAIERPPPRSQLTARAADFAMERIIPRYLTVLSDQRDDDEL